MKAIITHGPVAGEAIEITVEDFEEKWGKFNDLRARPMVASDTPFDVLKRITEERKADIQIARLEFMKIYQKASADTFLIFLSEVLVEMRELAISKARRKSNTLRDTGRALGEADAFDEIETLLDEIFKAGHNIDE